MAQECLKILKCMLFVFNLIFWICGCVILGLGIYLLTLNNYGALLSSLPSLSIANVLIVVGTVTMVVAFLGCMGAIKENKCLLLSFFTLLLLILLIEVTAAIILFFYEKQVTNYIKSDMKQALKHQNDTGIMEAWNRIQTQLHCCGVSNDTDWGDAVPNTCCPPDVNPCTSKHYFTKGCFGQVQMWFESNFLLLGIAVICVSIIQVLGMSFAMTMYCQICNNYKSYDN
ncbi:leukocyte surface antigen CD53-like [Scyliorhinus canicula]|uniref:leukocyte surface antigen CD53-like n=1 Tax=Scyliorhinus canicula TaxID=7830 RepID=UPI0018F2A3D9|nr:leukocyte surface antigen CD53-like [Scyliorhinus canicula]XP_038676063.1 leukocyte surface antigen CD53-like [Scyliorhinus canicula]XP_038676064.1 leukocyte surface antigen CD53-like [Scyliorhinus canicula]